MRYVLLVVALGLAVSILAYDQIRKGRAGAISLVAGNYRVLSQVESARLVHFGRDVRSCLVDRGLRVGPLVVRRTRISMELVSVRGAAAAAQLTACGEQLGGPPPRSSLQVRDADVLLYLPLRCLLDPKVVHSEAS
jgi:hypothetical protein